MTKLAYDPASLGVNPMLWRELPCVHTSVNHHWFAPAGEELSDLFSEWGKSAIETHHNKRCGASLYLRAVFFSQLTQLLAIDCQRFLNKDGLAAVQCLNDAGRMRVMASQDKYCIDIRVVYDLSGLFRSLEPESALRRSGPRS